MRIGDKVLWIYDMTEQWTVSDIVGNRVKVILREPRRAPVKSEDYIHAFVPTPKGWEDAPVRPDPWNHLMHTLRSDDRYLEDLAEWVPKMKEWEKRYRQPLLRQLAL